MLQYLCKNTFLLKKNKIKSLLHSDQDEKKRDFQLFHWGIREKNQEVLWLVSVKHNVYYQIQALQKKASIFDNSGAQRHV